MKILLVRPNNIKGTVSIRNFMFGEPIGLECVSTILKEQGHNIKFLDLMIDSVSVFKKTIKNFVPDVVGITTQCTDIDNVIMLADIVKKYNSKIKVVVGGVQATITPEAYFDKNIDYVFKSTTRENYKQLMEQIENYTKEEIAGVYSRKLQYQSSLPSCQNEYVRPDRELTEKYRKYYKYVGYQPCALLQTSYGCRNHCKFCVRWRIEGAKVFELPIEDVVKEIKSIKEKNIKIVDNDFLIREDRVLEFLDLIEKENIKKNYICFASANSILEKEYLFERLAKNGLKVVIVGFESCNDEMLKQWNKASNSNDTYKAVQILKKNNINVCGNFILDPDYTIEDFKNIKKYHKKLEPEMCTFTPLIPHPLTPLYKNYEDRLIYKYDDYERWNFGEVVVYPSKMSLKRFYLEMIKLTIPFNFNKCTVIYLLREYPLKNILKMLFGFNGAFKIYMKKLFRRD